MTLNHRLTTMASLAARRPTVGCFFTKRQLQSHLWVCTSARILGARHNSSRLPANNDEDDNRIPQIRMHPKGLGQRVLTGGFVMDKKGKKQYLEIALGYFWMMKDLSKTGNKPILSNETLIPEREAEMFPSLLDLTNLKNENVALPDCAIHNKAGSGCSLVTVAFKQFGNRQTTTWIEPFEKAFANRPDVQAYSVIITEGMLFKMLLKSLVIRGTRQHTPPEKHDQTLLYFGKPEFFRDILRMHNTLAGYAFLLDGKGRVRFAGSGEASSEEVERLIAFANSLLKSGSRTKIRHPPK